MTYTYIALDIETTGLDSDRDTILEIGAVRIENQTVQDTFSTLINPKRDIPYNIQQLTGITPDDVYDAPPIHTVIPELKTFVSDLPIVGHNIQFDLSFLRQHQVGEQNLGLDTFELASILLPNANRYSLTALIDYLEIDLADAGQAHRALRDAKVAHLLFEGLLTYARTLDKQIISQIARSSQHVRGSWPLGLVFQDLSREPHSSAAPPSSASFEPEDKPPKPLKPVETPEPLDVVKVCQTLEVGGLFEQAFSGFEHRPQQISMVAQVAEAFNAGDHLIIEAGTGTGKSIAYLLPALHWAVQNQQRVVVSTNTINLQDQLLKKDIPTLQKLLPLDFRAVALKGRSNYVCPKRVLFFQAKANHSPAELRLLSKLLVWLPQTTTGDKEELFMPNSAEQYLWWQVASDGQVCTSRTCTPETCFYAKARQQAERAHLIIVNHALLMADINVGGMVLPDYNHLVIDEAHHLEDSITNQLSFSADQRTVSQLLHELSYTTRNQTEFQGLINTIDQRCSAAAPPKARELLKQLIEQGHESARDSQKAIGQLFQAVHTFAADFSRNSQYSHKIRLTEETRNTPSWSNVELAWDQASQLFEKASKTLSQLNTMVVELESYDVPDWEDLLAEITLHRTRFDKTKNHLHYIITASTQDQIFWVEQNAKDNNTSLHSAPLHVGNLFHEHLLKTKDTIILTSATMRTNGSFEYMQERLHLWEVKQASVGSPFDYHRSTLLYIPTDMPLPHTANYTVALSKHLVALAKRLGGRTLVLFTAYSQLKQVAQKIRGPLSEAGVAVYQQGTGASRRQLLQNFKEAEQAILLGTRSFWEGVDIPGPDLSCVVITKIPFAVPSDPIIAARSQTFNNAFAQYSIPLAILMFRQGFGRLIRTQSDRGVVVIMDNRVVSKSYGQAFIDSLPEVTEQRDLLANLPAAAQQWVDNDSA